MLTSFDVDSGVMEIWACANITAVSGLVNSRTEMRAPAILGATISCVEVGPAVVGIVIQPMCVVHAASPGVVYV